MTRTERIAKLKKAKEMLAAWELAELKVTSGEEYEIEGRKLKMVNMSHIVNAQARWRQEIKRLEIEFITPLIHLVNFKKTIRFAI